MQKWNFGEFIPAGGVFLVHPVLQLTSIIFTVIVEATSDLFSDKIYFKLLVVFPIPMIKCTLLRYKS